MAPFFAFDDGRGILAPLTDLRPSFDLRTGAMTTLERLQATLRGFCLGLVVPDPMASLTRERHAAPVNAPPTRPALYVNGRAPLVPDSAAMLEPGQAIIEGGSGDLVAAHLDPDQASAFVQGKSPPLTIVESLDEPTLLARPWHIRAFRDRCISKDLEILISDPGREPPPSVMKYGDHPVRIAPSARVYPGTVLDLEGGPIMIDEHAVIRPGAILIGPCYIGPHSTVLERATIRPYTSIGPWCKVNGEIGGTIFQGYANKAHDGYIGDAYVGEWVNLGAGTTTSNLLNTYGEIIARPAAGEGNEATGQQFLGPVIGDHVKTAICTRLMTGSILHTGGMIASATAASGHVPAFAWITDAGRRAYRLDKFVEVMRAAMARRKLEPTAAYLERISALHGASAVT